MHIGTHKTATSSFQQICSDKKNLLSVNGINFPSFKNWTNHCFASWIAQRREFSELKVFLESIYAESLELNCGVTLVSGEDFENFLVDTDLAKEFIKIAIEVGFNEIEWVVVQRQAFDYLQSIYAEMSQYQVVLDYERMANLILDYGFVSPGGRRYNYKFVFDLKKFGYNFQHTVSSNFSVVPFNEFTNDFVGRVFFSEYLTEEVLNDLRTHAMRIGKKQARHNIELVEFNYVANFLGVTPGVQFYNANKGLVDSLVVCRLERNARLLDSIKQEFDNREF